MPPSVEIIILLLQTYTIWLFSRGQYSLISGYHFLLLYSIRVLEVMSHSLATLKEKVNHQGTLDITVCIFKQMFRLCCCQPSTTGFGEQREPGSAVIGSTGRLFETGHLKSLHYEIGNHYSLGDFLMRVILYTSTTSLAFSHQASNKDLHHSKAIIAFLP